MRTSLPPSPPSCSFAPSRNQEPWPASLLVCTLYAPTSGFLLDLVPYEIHCHHAYATLPTCGPQATLSSPASCWRAPFSHLLAFRCCPLGGVESGETARARRGWRRASVLRACGGESLPGARRTRHLSHLAILT